MYIIFQIDILIGLGPGIATSSIVASRTYEVKGWEGDRLQMCWRQKNVDFFVGQQLVSNPPNHFVHII